MKHYITIDGGTTNTRIHLTSGCEVISALKLSVGAKDGCDKLKSAVSLGIKELLLKNSLHESDVTAIIASGMITSEYGLCNLPHVSVPAGIPELAESMKEEHFPDITSIPWYFIRGVKTFSGTPDGTDVMRGEETELMGIITSGENTLYVMPGTHSKHVSIDKTGRIVKFKTMMTGELFAAVAGGTILRDAIDLSSAKIVESRLSDGCRYARDCGINEALFKTRILKNLLGASTDECYSFLLGAILADEVTAILLAKENNIVLTGQKQLKEALMILLSDSGKAVSSLSDSEVALSTVIGAIKIFEAK